MEVALSSYISLVMQEFHCNKKTAELIIASARLNGLEEDFKKELTSSYETTRPITTCDFLFDVDSVSPTEKLYWYFEKIAKH